MKKKKNRRKPVLENQGKRMDRSAFIGRAKQSAVWQILRKTVGKNGKATQRQKQTSTGIHRRLKSCDQKEVRKKIAPGEEGGNRTISRPGGVKLTGAGRKTSFKEETGWKRQCKDCCRKGTQRKRDLRG